jgi:fructose-bisphosphate aldolase, class II
MLLNALQARQLFNHALEHRYAILAVNADSASCITDVLEAARESDSPIIIETSLWQLKGRSFGAGNASLGMARYMVQIAQLANSEPYKNVPVLYHTDHIKGPEAIALLKHAIRGLETRIMDVTVPLRPSTVSLDSSDFSEEDNIMHTLSLCQTAQEAGVPVTLEMEAGVDDGLTPLDLARAFRAKPWRRTNNLPRESQVIPSALRCTDRADCPKKHCWLRSLPVWSKSTGRANPC